MALSPESTPLNICITTFNCGRKEVDTRYFASSLHGELKRFTARKEPVDLIVLALQEFAPIGPSFVGGRVTGKYWKHLHEAVQLATEWSYTRDVQYELVLTRNVGLTGIMVFARAQCMEHITSVRAAGTGVGVWDMGNKGAVAVRLEMYGQQFTFVSAHLAPGEEQCERRNADWRKICENLVFEQVDPDMWKKAAVKAIPPTTPAVRAGPSHGGSETEPLLADNQPLEEQEQDHGLFTPIPSFIFVAGDLNYRASDTPPKPEDSTSCPQPMAANDDPQNHKFLFEKDQLTRELKAGRTLHHLAEAPVSFPPTYKYSSGAQKLAAANAGVASSGADAADSQGKCNSSPKVDIDDAQEQVWLWAKHRMPSWCDRILYLSDSEPELYSYKALPVQPTSDHRPVSMTFGIYHQKGLRGAKKPPFKVTEGWKGRRVVARRLEYLVGIPWWLLTAREGHAIVLVTMAFVAGLIFLTKRGSSTA